MKEVKFNRLVQEVIGKKTMTQTELAARIGVSSSTVTKIKDGTIEYPKYNIACRLIEIHEEVIKTKRKSR